MIRRHDRDYTAENHAKGHLWTFLLPNQGPAQFKDHVSHLKGTVAPEVVHSLCL
jgi:hypothetical protein